MSLGIRKKYWWYLGATILLAGLMVFLHLSPVFAVKGAVMQGPFAERLDGLSQKYLNTGENIFRFDRSRLARDLLHQDKIGNVRLSLSLPNGIKGDVNRFEPVVLVMTDQIYGLDRHCRLVPYDPAWKNLDVPVLTGLKVIGLFQVPDDFRVAEVINGLIEIENRMPDLYRQIAEIDFSDDVYVSIYLTTGTDRYLAVSRNFTAQLIKLDVVSRTVARSDDGCYNLLYDGVVIKQKQ